MGSDIRGPMCSTRCGPGWIDDGTMCLNRSYPFGPVGATSTAKIVSLKVVKNATQKNVIGNDNWVAVKKTSAYATLEMITYPNNTPAEWNQIVWFGDTCVPVPGRLNRRKLPLAASKKFHVEAALGGVKVHINLWVLSATIDIKISGQRPKGAAPFDPNTRDNTDKLGAVTYQSLTDSVIDENAGVFVKNMGATGKVVPVAILSPKGIHKIIKSGLAFHRQVWSHNWVDGFKTQDYNNNWTSDTSKPHYLRLTPDKNDKIYDLDAPDIRWGQKSYETYNKFQQWIEWNQQKCSDYAYWYWQARWILHKNMAKQITLNDVGTGSYNLPAKPHYPARKFR